jgi:hypothetical protein
MLMVHFYKGENQRKRCQGQQEPPQDFEQAKQKEGEQRVLAEPGSLFPTNPKDNEDDAAQGQGRPSRQGFDALLLPPGLGWSSEARELGLEITVSAERGLTLGSQGIRIGNGLLVVALVGRDVLIPFVGGFALHRASLLWVPSAHGPSCRRFEHSQGVLRWEHKSSTLGDRG